MFKVSKRLLALVLALCLLSSVTVSAFADDEETIDNTIYLSTAEDLVDFSANCTFDTWSEGVTVELQNDISLEGVAFTPIASFSGTFHGNGYTISGLSLSEGLSLAGLFQRVQEGARIEDLNVSGTVKASSSCEAAGGLAGRNAGEILRCSFSGSVAGSAMVGGLVGENTASGVIAMSSSNGAVTGSSMTGGAAGMNRGQILGCTNGAYVNTVSGDQAISLENVNLDFSLDMTKLTSGDALLSSYDTGGIAGYNAGTLRACENKAIVGYQHVGYNVGGIAGRSCGYVLNCTNSGAVYGRKDVGGVVGQMEPYVEMQLTESSLSKLQTQLDELSTLVDKAADDAEGGVGGVTSSLNGMSGYVQNAADAAKDLKVNIDASGSILGQGGASGSGGVTVTPPSVSVDGGIGHGSGLDISVEPGSVSIDHGSGIGAGGSIDNSDFGIGAGGDVDVGGLLTGGAQIVAAPDLGNLNSAIGGISGQIARLNGALSGAAGTLANDVRQINRKFGEITDTLQTAIDDAQDNSSNVITDASAIDVDLVTLGKVNRCENTAYVDGDLNVGGIAGSMAIEYSYDPEDDVTGDLSAEYKRQYELKAIIQNCTNEGDIQSKRSYAGGICGRMDLGLITDCSGFGSVSSDSGDCVGGIAGQTGSTVRESFSKCSLSGAKYVGGIVGAGAAKTVSGAASTVSGNYSMVEITSATQFSGAISGSDAGDFAENYFVADNLAGLDTVSLAGKAEPISYDELLDVDGLPKAMRQLELKFVADDEVLKVETFNYGDSFDDTVYPEIPEKDGYYGTWDTNDLTELHFDTTVTVEYTRYVTTVPGETRRDSGRPVFFVDGSYDESARPVEQALAQSNSGLCPVSAGLGQAVSHYMSVNPWYTWFSRPITKEVLEQWSLTLPQDGENTHTVHYLSPSESTRHLTVFLRQDGGWKRVQTDTFGSYLTFDVTGTQAEIAAVTVVHIWWVWVILAVLILGVLALVIILIAKAARKHKKAQPVSETEAAQDAQPQKKKFPVWLTVLLMLLALAAAAAAVWFFVLRSHFAPYEALVDLKECAELSMDVALDADVADETLSLDAELERKTVSGRRVTKVQAGSLPLYYAENLVVLENGTAYQLTTGFPDYASILEHLLPLYKKTSFTTLRDGDETIYGVSAEGQTARALLSLLLPDASGNLPDGQTVSAEVHMEDGAVEKITISASGSFKDKAQTPFTLYVTLDDFDASTDFSVPDAVLESLDKTYADGELPVITEDLFRLLTGWSNLLHEDTIAADLDISVDCGPVVVKNALRYYRETIDGTTVNCINKSGLNIYFSDTGSAVNVNGDEAGDDARSLAGTTKLLDIVYLVCQNGEFELSQEGETYTYRLSLDERSMDSLLEALAPDAAKLDMTFEDSYAEVTLTDGTVSKLSVSCGGAVKVLLTQAGASVTADITFTDDTMPEPSDEVLSALR